MLPGSKAFAEYVSTQVLTSDIFNPLMGPSGLVLSQRSRKKSDRQMRLLEPRS